MRVLILEDDPARKLQFVELFRGHDVTVVEIAATAIGLLINGLQWDLLSLDHDLGGEVMVESGPGTGYEVAVYLEEFPEWKPTRITIHSLNPVGAERMHQALPEAIMFPGLWFCKSVEAMIEAIGGNTQWDGLIDCSDVEQRGLQPPLHTTDTTDTGITDTAEDGREQDRNAAGIEQNEDTDTQKPG